MAAATTELDVTRLGGVLGARVDGLNLSKRLDDATFAALQRIVWDFSVVVIPGQAGLTPQQLIDFASQWGEFTDMPEYASVLEGYTNLYKAYTAPGAAAGGAHWHTDFSYLKRPAYVTLLFARTLPPAGGDTEWASQYEAYERLSPAMKRLAESLRAVHTRKKVFRREDGSWTTPESTAHPCVRTVPETGRKALYLNPFAVSHFEGMTEDESKGLLDFLTAHCTDPSITYRHRWVLGDLVVWDNRTVQHQAIQDYKEEREMWRATIQGEVPLSGEQQPQRG
jgi:taurine dioxygenase